MTEHRIISDPYPNYQWIGAISGITLVACKICGAVVSAFSFMDIDWAELHREYHRKRNE